MTVWYRVRDFDAGRAFYRETLGFEETDGVNVGTVLELHGHVRLLDVYDPDGNRVQLAQDLVP